MTAKRRKTPEEIAGEMYSLTATAIENDKFGFEALAQHIPYALGHNKDSFVAWKRRVLPPEGKVVELERFEDYLLLPVREGFGLPSLHFVDGALKLLGKKGQKALAALRQEIPDWDARIEKERLSQTVKEAPVLAESRRPTKQEQADNRDIGTVNRGSNSATYLTARIKRDAPDIAARLERGEFKSVRAAAIEAGIVKVATPLDAALAAYRRLSPEEQAAFQQAMGMEGRS